MIDQPDAPVDQIAMALFNRGIIKGKSGDSAGALADYSLAIDLPDSPVYMVAYAFFNRARLQAKGEKADEAVADLERWRELADQPRRSMLDNESDFDKIRQTKIFTAFRESLPE